MDSETCRKGNCSVRLHFPGDDFLPEPRPVVVYIDRPAGDAGPPGRSPMRLPLRSRLRTHEIGADPDTRYALYNFAKYRAMELISSALDQVDTALTTAREKTKGKAGRKRIWSRAALLQGLAETWVQSGLELSPRGVPEIIRGETTYRSGMNFDAFCDAIFGCIGWPTGGLGTAIQEAKASVSKRTGGKRTERRENQLKA